MSASLLKVVSVTGDLTSLSFQFIKFALNAHFMCSKPPMVLGDQVSNIPYKMLLQSVSVSLFVVFFPQS